MILIVLQSAGIAMISFPPVVMLDEPTTAVDPLARRQFWKIITSIRGSNQAVILTSHRCVKNGLTNCETKS